MTHNSKHALDAATIHETIRLLQRTWVGRSDEETLFAVLSQLRVSLTTPLDEAAKRGVIPSR